MKRCKTCKHWEQYKDDFDIKYHGKHAGKCDSEKWVESDKCPTDGVMYWDHEEYSAGFETGEDFGCVHWHEPCMEEI